MNTLSSYDGTRLAYEQVGHGPPLLCLPGGPGRAAAYLEDLGGVDRTRTLVRLDLRATGSSEVPADPASLRFDRMAADVEALREHLGLERADVLAHSAGALVAQAWAAAHPERVGRLVLVTPSDRLQGGRREDVPAIRASRAGEPWYAEAAEAQDAVATAPPAQQQALVRATRPFFYGRWDERTQAHAATADRQSSRRAELGFGAGLEDVDVGALLAGLAQVRAPVLVVGGERDALTGVASVERVGASFRPPARWCCRARATSRGSTRRTPSAAPLKPSSAEPPASRRAVVLGQLFPQRQSGRQPRPAWRSTIRVARAVYPIVTQGPGRAAHASTYSPCDS